MLLFQQHGIANEGKGEMKQETKAEDKNREVHKV